MRYIFKAQGNKNIHSTHKTTLEITKDKNISKRGNCIIAVNADFSLSTIKKVIKNKKVIHVTFTLNKITEKVIAKINHNFRDNNELIIRKTNFISERTFGICANKSSNDLSRELIEKLRNPDAVLFITIEAY